MNIKDMVKDNKQVTFDHYRDGDLASSSRAICLRMYRMKSRALSCFNSVALPTSEIGTGNMNPHSVV